jgi:predicted transcriptional regulator
MASVTLRVDDETWEAVKDAAAREGQSANAFVTTTIKARVDPETAGDGLDQIRERLRRAGLLEEPVRPPGPRRPRPDPDAVRAAGERMGRGKPLSDYVIEGRQ